MTQETLEQGKRPYPVVRSAAHQIGRIRVVQDTILIGGAEHPYTYVDYPDSVAVFPVCEGGVVTIEQYRHTLNAWMEEIPAGGIDPGERAADAARRELREETGYEAGELTDLGSYYINQGVSTSRCRLFFARCACRGAPQAEQTELIRVRVVPLAEFERRVEENRFQFLIGLTGWHQAKARGLVRSGGGVGN